MLITRSTKHSAGETPEKIKTEDIPDDKIIQALTTPPYPVLKWGYNTLFLGYWSFVHTYADFTERRPDLKGTVITLTQT